MCKVLHQGEVTSVVVSTQFSLHSRLSCALFRLEVTAWSSFLHPAACQEILEKGESCSYVVRRRYKDLAKLHEQMKWLFADLPTFPPKQWLVMKPETSLQRRTHQLNVYFSKLLEIGEIRRSQVLLDALCPSTRVSLRTIGSSAACKSFLQLFLNYSPVPYSNKAIRCSANLQPSREQGQMDWKLPVDLIVDGHLLRITDMDQIVLNEEEASPWLLHHVKNKGVVLVIKGEKHGNGQKRFAESLWLLSDKAVDTVQQGKKAYEAVCAVVRHCLQLVTVQ